MNQWSDFKSCLLQPACLRVGQLSQNLFQVAFFSQILKKVKPKEKKTRMSCQLCLEGIYIPGNEVYIWGTLTRTPIVNPNLRYMTLQPTGYV